MDRVAVVYKTRAPARCWPRRSTGIDVATVNGQPYLCSSTLAMMPHLGRLRERARGRLGLGALRLLGRALRLVRRYPRYAADDRR
ncbi:MAG TPA: hypothetical protein VFC19_15215 [Candidatus Limnocylindrales bacterium]|nr:hypothetical protein [Candidatus Limnocylindrales bacterium]